MVFARTPTRFIGGTVLTVQVAGEGQTIRIEVADISGGALPIPRRLLSGVAADAIAKAVRSFHKRAPLEAQPQASKLWSEIEIPNRFVWPNGERAFRVAEIKIDDDAVLLTIEPAR